MNDQGYSPLLPYQKKITKLIDENFYSDSYQIKNKLKLKKYQRTFRLFKLLNDRASYGQYEIRFLLTYKKKQERIIFAYEEQGKKAVQNEHMTSISCIGYIYLFTQIFLENCTGRFQKNILIHSVKEKYQHKKTSVYSDKDLKNTTIETFNLIKNEKTQRIRDWTGDSPDLNYIKNLWDYRTQYKKRMRFYKEFLIAGVFPDVMGLCQLCISIHLICQGFLIYPIAILAFVTLQRVIIIVSQYQQYRSSNLHEKDNKLLSALFLNFLNLNDTNLPEYVNILEPIYLICEIFVDYKKELKQGYQQLEEDKDLSLDEQIKLLKLLSQFKDQSSVYIVKYDLIANPNKFIVHNIVTKEAILQYLYEAKCIPEIFFPNTSYLNLDFKQILINRSILQLNDDYQYRQFKGFYTVKKQIQQIQFQILVFHKTLSKIFGMNPSQIIYDLYGMQGEY
ncbi:hypothetical protein ABPG74_016083 [Tetrahymena malaccensis]